MNWRYKKVGIHIEARVYMHGALCGVLNFTEGEFEQIKRDALSRVKSPIYAFINEDSPTGKETITIDDVLEGRKPYPQ
jgi:hypothetical protein